MSIHLPVYLSSQCGRSRPVATNDHATDTVLICKSTPARGSVDLELRRMLLFTVSLSTSAALALQPPLATRRQAVAGAAGCMLGAETAWTQAVAAAVAAGVHSPEDVQLPPGTVEEIEAGRIVVVKNWLPRDELMVLRADAQAAARWSSACAAAARGKVP